MRKLYICLPVLLCLTAGLTAQVSLKSVAADDSRSTAMRTNGTLQHFTSAVIIELLKNISQRESEKATAGIEKGSLAANYEYYFKEFAEKHGFTSGQVKELVDQWANTDSVKEDVNDYMLQGARNYYLQQFEASALNYEKAATFWETALWEKYNGGDQLTKEMMADADSAGNAWLLAGNSAGEGNDFKKAIQLYYKADSLITWAATGQAITEAFAKKKRRLNDLLAIALYEEGSRAAGTESLTLLAQAVAIEQAALVTYRKEAFPHDWARTQSNLGTLLQEQGDRMDDSTGDLLLHQSIAAYRAALDIYTKTDFPKDWARTQNNIGVVSRKLAGRVDEPGLFEQSIAAFRAALEVYTKNDFARDWALTQNNLGVTLQEQGTLEGKGGSHTLWQQAVTACRAALEVYTQKEDPQDWALTQHNLGNILQLQGTHTEGHEGALLLEQSAAAYRAALEIYTQPETPQQWGRVQHNLGVTLSELGLRTEGTTLLAQAATAFRAALVVRTQECFPAQWARTQSNLGTVLWEQGSRTEGDEGAVLLQQAAQAFKRALEIYTRNDFPEQWLDTQNNLGSVYEQSRQWAAAINCFENIREANPIYVARKVNELRKKSQQ